jgi:hypothetical protein
MKVANSRSLIIDEGGNRMKAREIVSMLKEDIEEQENFVAAHQARLMMLRRLLTKIENNKGDKNVLLQPISEVSFKPSPNVEYSGFDKD